MKFFGFVIISVFFYLHFTEANILQLCTGVTYKGVANDDETGETIFTYSFKMGIVVTILPYNYDMNTIQVTDIDVKYVRNSSLKFHHLSYTEKYQGCNSMIDIEESHDFDLPNQKIKFILSFGDREEETSGNDACQSNQTRFVDTITIFLTNVNIFNAENGQFFDNSHNAFTKDNDKPTEKIFLNGNKSVECTDLAFLTIPDTVEESCTNFEGNFTVLNLSYNYNKTGQILYSIDSEFMNVSLHSSEDWYMHILPYCVDNSTECLITFPPIDEDFQYPIQLITSFGNFYIAYLIRRNGMFLKYKYLVNAGFHSYNFSMDTYTSKNPCWDHSSLYYPNLNGTIDSSFCCTKFIRNPPTTTATTKTAGPTTAKPFESTQMSILTSIATTAIPTADFLKAKPPQLCDSLTYRGDGIDDESGETIFTYSFVLKNLIDVHYSPICYCNVVQVTDFDVTFLQNSSLKFHQLSYTENYQGCNSLINILAPQNLWFSDQEIKFILTFNGDDEEIPDNDICPNNKTRFVDTITLFLNGANIFNAETGQFFDDSHKVFIKDDEELKEKKFLNGSKSVECTNFAYNLSLPNTVEDKSSKKTTTILIICGSIVGVLIILSALIILYFYRKKKQQRKDIEELTSKVGTNILKNLRPDFANFLLPTISPSVYDEFEIEWNKLIFTTSILGAGAFGHILQGKLINGSTKNGIYEHDFIDVAIKMPQKTASDSVCAAFLDEINLMKKINGNKNIIKMHGYVTKGPRICLILEYCCHKDLLHCCKKLKNDHQNFGEIKKQTEKEFFIFTWQISHGMQFLASKNIIHCDLAARNILIDKDKNAKISDFGLSVQLESGTEIIKADTGKLPIKWLSLETLKFQQFSLNSDIWSFGVLLYEMYSFGSTPYAEIDDFSVLLQHLEDGNRLGKPMFCSDKIYNLMTKCWNSVPTLRPSINELIATFKEFLEESTEGYGYLQILNE